MTKRIREIRRACEKVLDEHGGRLEGVVYRGKHPMLVFIDDAGERFALKFSLSPRASGIKRSAQVVSDDVARHFKGPEYSRAIPYSG